MSPIKRKRKCIGLIKRILVFLVAAGLPLGLFAVNAPAYAPTEKTKDVDIYVGYFGDAYIKLCNVTEEEMETLDCNEYTYSSIDRGLFTRYNLAYGVLLTSLLEYVGIDDPKSDVDVIYFLGDDNDYYAGFYNLFGVRHYYFPWLAEYYDQTDPSESNTMIILSEYYEVPAILAFEQSLARDSGHFNYDRYKSAMSDENCLRVVFGQTQWDEVSTSDSVKWVYEIAIQLKGSPIKTSNWDAQIGSSQSLSSLYTVDSGYAELDDIISSGLRIWSDDTSVVRINDDGTLTATGKGVGRIMIEYLSSDNGNSGSFSETIFVTVKDNPDDPVIDPGDPTYEEDNPDIDPGSGSGSGQSQGQTQDADPVPPDEDEPEPESEPEPDSDPDPDQSQPTPDTGGGSGTGTEGGSGGSGSGSGGSGSGSTGSSEGDGGGSGSGQAGTGSGSGTPSTEDGGATEEGGKEGDGSGGGSTATESGGSGSAGGGSEESSSGVAQPSAEEGGSGGDPSSTDSSDSSSLLESVQGFMEDLLDQITTDPDSADSAEIAAQIDSMLEDLEEQIESSSDSAELEAILNRIAELAGQLETATTSEEIEAILEEIQAYLDEVLGEDEEVVLMLDAPETDAVSEGDEESKAVYLSVGNTSGGNSPGGSSSSGNTSGGSGGKVLELEQTPLYYTVILVTVMAAVFVLGGLYRSLRFRREIR